jgi:hypothetical protein
MLGFFGDYYPLLVIIGMSAFAAVLAGVSITDSLSQRD